MKQQNHQWALSGGKWGVSCLSHLGHKAEKEKKRKKEHMRLHLGRTKGPTAHSPSHNPRI
jgi:hypothetical protein